MGKDSAPRLLPCIIIITAMFVFLASAVLLGFGHGVKSMHGFSEMNTMAKQESTTHTAPGGEPPNHPNVFTLNKAMTAVMVLGALGMLASLGACIGAKLENQCLLLTYFFVVITFGGFLFLVANYAAEFSDVMEPVMARQIDSFCNETSYRTYKSELGCYNPGEPTPAPPSQNSVTTAPSRLLMQNQAAAGTEAHVCGEECQSRVAMLKSIGACNMLKDLCTNWVFSELSAYIATKPAAEQPAIAPKDKGYCMLAADIKAYNFKNMNANGTRGNMLYKECEDFCNYDITCTGFSYTTIRGSCRLITPVEPTYGHWELDNPTGGATPSTQVLQGIVNSDGTVGIKCYIKTLPKMETEMETKVAELGWYSMIGAIFFSVTALVTCCFMFTLGTKKQGKKGPGAMAFKLLCPCCAGEAGPRKGESGYNGISDYDTDSGKG